MKHFWEERYGKYDTVYGTEPNVFFKAQLDVLTPGSILLPAEGEGRNALYAAANGWLVTAFDYSETARKKTLEKAAERKLIVQYDTKDITSFVAKEQYDVVALIYVHLPEQLRTAFHREIFTSLSSGGVLILEAFSKQQIGNTSGGPSDPALLYDRATILEDFNQLDVELCEEVCTELDEGVFHNGKANVVRFVGRKHRV